MLQHLALTADPRRVLLLHADRSAGSHALRRDMEDLADALPGADRVFWYESGPGGRPGRIDLTGVEVPGDAVGYLCGPLEFMRDARERLIRAGVAARDIHYEVFGPDLWLPAA